MPFISISFVCILISFFIGYLGRNRKMGFWGYFFATLFLTPFVGAILLLISDNKNAKEKDTEDSK